MSDFNFPALLLLIVLTMYLLLNKLLRKRIKRPKPVRRQKKYPQIWDVTYMNIFRCKIIYEEPPTECPRCGNSPLEKGYLGATWPDEHFYFVYCPCSPLIGWQHVTH